MGWDISQTTKNTRAPGGANRNTRAPGGANKVQIKRSRVEFSSAGQSVQVFHIVAKVLKLVILSDPEL